MSAQPSISDSRITSTQNPRVKDLLRLSRGSFRRRAGRFLVEGSEELEHFWQSGWPALSLLVCPDHCPPDLRAIWESRARQRSLQVEYFGVNAFGRFAYREQPTGLMVEAQIPSPSLAALPPPPAESLLVVLDRIEKPGNVGALLRSAAAAGATALICSGTSTDPGNPNLIRSSRGLVFRVPFFIATEEETLAWLEQHGFTLYSADAAGTQLLGQVSYPPHTAVVLGTEDTGLCPFWRQACHASVRIPMAAGVDSLNVSVAGALLLYDYRQRQGWSGTAAPTQRSPS